jgi:hypothetical protein
VNDTQLDNLFKKGELWILLKITHNSQMKI